MLRKLVVVLGVVMLAACAHAADPQQPKAMRYGLTGKMGVKPGTRDAVVAILMRDVQELKKAGCVLYVISVAKDQPDFIFITEVWESPEAHKASLKLPTVQKAIAEVRPQLSGVFEHVELSVAGGVGID